MAVKTDCSHRFVATKEKGKWDVRVVATSNKENFSIEQVTTTIFKCSLCNAKKEFPDNWERSYIAPDLTVTEPVATKRAAPAKKRVRPAV
jgi:hypothetical protein